MALLIGGLDDLAPLPSAATAALAMNGMANKPRLLSLTAFPPSSPHPAAVTRRDDVGVARVVARGRWGKAQWDQRGFLPGEICRASCWFVFWRLPHGSGPPMRGEGGGVLRITHRDNPPSASIHEEATISTDMPFMAVFNNLVMFDPDSPQNRLDKSFRTWRHRGSGDDDRTLTFQLRDGVKWHDGQPFTSADVKCTWDMVTGKLRGFITT